MLAHPEIQARVAAHGEVPRTTDWDPIDAALYAPHPFLSEPKEAAAFRFSAIRKSFAYQVEHNAFYRRYCETADVSSDDLRPRGSVQNPPCARAPLQGVSRP